MTKYIKGKDGKFAGSIGDGKIKAPTSAPSAPGGHLYSTPVDVVGDPFASVRNTTRPVISAIHNPSDFPVTKTMVEQIGTPTILSVSGGRIAAISPTTIVLPVDKKVTVEVEYNETSDTYTVRRLEPLMRGAIIMENPNDDIPPGFMILGEQEDVHYDELGERVYWAGMYHNGSFPNEV
jgi:hypothetical protein